MWHGGHDNYPDEDTLRSPAGQQENATLFSSSAGKSSERNQEGFTLSPLHSDPGKLGPFCAMASQCTWWWAQNEESTGQPIAWGREMMSNQVEGGTTLSKVLMEFKYGPHWSKGQKRECRVRCLTRHAEENRRAHKEPEAVPCCVQGNVTMPEICLSRLDSSSVGSGPSGRGLWQRGKARTSGLGSGKTLIWKKATTALHTVDGVHVVRSRKAGNSSTCMLRKYPRLAWGHLVLGLVHSTNIYWTFTVFKSKAC